MPNTLPSKTRKARRVIVFGVFDLLHPGHIRFLAHAKRLGDELIVVLTPDHRVRQEKGHAPYHPARERKTLLSALRMVDRVLLGDPGKRWTVIKRLAPHVIVLGPDQSADHPQIQKQLGSLRVRPTLHRYVRPRAKRHASSTIRGLNKRQFRKSRDVP